MPPSVTLMSTSTPILHHYETIAGLSRQMLEHARADNWDDVITLGKQYYDAVESLRTFPPLDSADRLARKGLLSQILDDDAKIRALAAPELSRLGHLLGSINRQRSVLHAYCAPSLHTS